MSQTGEDCYFFYYSTCSKGDSCPFRHCAQALGSETVCTAWKEQRCFRQSCMFRHMDIKTNRATTPCYWESQPGGCTKPHCVFLHSVKKERGLLTQKNRVAPMVPAPDGVAGLETADTTDDVDIIITPQVAPIVVNPCDEESDADSTTSGSPVKKVAIKKLVKRTEPRALPPEQPVSTPRVISRISIQRKPSQAEESDFGIKTLDDIRREELEHAKEVLAEADELLNSSVDPDLLPTHSIDELVEDLDDEVRDQLCEGASQRRIQLSAPAGGRQVQLADSTTGSSLGGRRIVVVDEEVSAERTVASPKKKQTLVLSRLGGRSIQKVENAPPREPEGQSVYSRLGLKRASDVPDKEEKMPLKAATNVRSRLGLKRQMQRDSSEDTEADTTTTSQSRLKGRLGVVKTVSLDSTTSKDTSSISTRLGGSRGGIQSRLGLSDQSLAAGEGTHIKSFDEIRRAKLARVSSKSSPERKTAMDLEDTKPKLISQRLGKQEREIYRPPASKTDEKAVVRRKTVPDTRQELQPRKKAVGWGVKTFSEIMQEKRLRKQAGQAEPSADFDPEDTNTAATSVKQRLGLAVAIGNTKRSFSPISFSSEGTVSNPQPKKNKKFKPIVFDLDEEEPKEAGPSRVMKPLSSRRGEGDGENGSQKQRLSPVTFDTSSADVAVSSTNDPLETTVFPPKRRALQKLIISPSGEKQSVKPASLHSPPVKSPPVKSLPVRSPPVVTCRDKVRVSPVTSPPTSRRASAAADDRRASLTKMDTDDSFLNDMDDLLDDGNDIGTTTVDDIGEDDLLNEMEELLA